MKVLALDLSSKSTGWSFFEGEKLITYGCITCANPDSLFRIKKMTEEIKKIHQNFKPDSVICEDILPEDVHHNQNVFRTLQYLQAAVVLGLHDLGQKVEFYVSSEWRKKCGIKTGRGIKRDSLKFADVKFVKDNYNIDVNDDIADAICIGWAYTHVSSVEEPADSSGFDFR